MKKIIFTAGIIVGIWVINLHAKNAGGSYTIIENKGQWSDSVRYKVDIANGSLFITDYGWVYDFVDVKDMERYHDLLSLPNQSAINSGNSEPSLPDSFAYRGHAYRVSFVGSNPAKTQYEPLREKVTKYHYYLGNHKKDWHTNVRGYDALLQKEVYKHIDLQLYQNGTTLKYDFVVHPGGDYRDIVLKYEGVIPQIQEDGTLLIETSVNTVTEDKPYVYQVINNRKKEIRAAYRKNKLGHIVFELTDNYDKTQPLLIDPKLIFATYSGCTGFSLAYASTYDNDGNLYAMGTQLLAGDRYKNIFQGYTTYVSRGGSGIGINKYSADGTVLYYSIALSGFSSESPSCLTVDEARNLYVGLVGYYTSYVPMHDSALYTRSKGGDDVYICKVNEAGDKLLGATFLGGSNEEGNYIELDAFYAQRKVEIKILNDNKIGIISQSRSTDYPVTSDALYPNYGGGRSDGVFTVLDGNLSKLIYSTYIGGSGEDFCSDIVFTADKKIVLTGGTRSTNFITTPGVYQRDLKGRTDGFVMIMDEAYNLEKSTYFGTDSSDYVYLADVDKEGNIYTLCYSGSYGLPLSNDGFHIDSGNYKLFIFNKDLSRINRGVRIGTFIPSAFMVDVCGFVYLSGYDLDKAPLTPDAFGNQGLWVGVFTPDLYGLKFATRYGTPSDHYHNGVVRFDKKGVMYQTVCSDNPGYPTTPGVVYPDKVPNTGIEPISFKADTEPEIVFAEIRIPTYLNDTGCAPYTLPFRNYSGSPHPITYEWDFGTGVTDTAFEPTYTFTQPGTYQVVLKATSLKSCNQADYDTFTVHIVNRLVDIYMDDTVLCSNVAYYDIIPRFSYLLTDSAQYIWSGSAGMLGDTSGSRLRVNPKENAVYYLTVYDSIPGVCAVSLRDTVVVDMVYRNFEIKTVPSCFNAENGMAFGVKDNNDTTAFTYIWLTEGMDTLHTGDTFQHVQAGDYYLNVVSSKCNNIFRFTVDAITEKVSIVYDSIICQNKQVIFQADLNTEVYPGLQWIFEGDSVGNGNRFDTLLRHAGRYKMQLIGDGPICKDSMEVWVIVDTQLDGRFLQYPDSICVGEKITFTPIVDTTVTQLHWHFDKLQFSTNSQGALPHAFDEAGTIPITLQTNYRVCPDTVHTNYVHVYANPIVYLGSDSSLCYQGKSILLKNLITPSANTDSYLWSTGDTTPTLKVTSPGVYSLVQKSPPLECVGSESITINKDCFVDIPNVFTPNGDGVNDYFFPREWLSRGIDRFHLQIFNRWGQLIFETRNREGLGWDGKWNGSEQPMDVYVYRITVSFKNGSTESYEGNVTLIR